MKIINTLNSIRNLMNTQRMIIVINSRCLLEKFHPILTICLSGEFNIGISMMKKIFIDNGLLLTYREMQYSYAMDFKPYRNCRECVG